MVTMIMNNATNDPVEVTRVYFDREGHEKLTAKLGREMKKRFGFEEWYFISHFERMTYVPPPPGVPGSGMNIHIFMKQ